MWVLVPECRGDKIGVCDPFLIECIESCEQGSPCVLLMSFVLCKDWQVCLSPLFLLTPHCSFSGFLLRTLNSFTPSIFVGTRSAPGVYTISKLFLSSSDPREK